MDIPTYFTLIATILMVSIIIALFLAFLYMVYGSEGERETKAPANFLLRSYLSLRFTPFL